MGLFRRRRSEQDRMSAGVPQIPAEVLTRAGLQRRERVLAGAQDDMTGSWVVLTTFRMIVVSQTAVESARPWLEVDAGSWDPESGALSLTWVGGGRAMQWRFLKRTGPGRVPETFRERVSASIVLQEHLDLGGGRTARVVIREDLSTRELREQVLLGRRARADDAELAEQIRGVRTLLRDQVGMPVVLPLEGAEEEPEAQP